MQTLTVSLNLPASICAATGLDEQELSQFAVEAFAVELYRQRRVSLGKAAEIAGIGLADMTAVLAKHDVHLPYDADDAQADWQTLDGHLGHE